MYIFQLRLKELTEKKIKAIADKQGRSLNKQIEFIIKAFIEDYEKVNGKIAIDEEEHKTTRK